jgi:hypothetical protein
MAWIESHEELPTHPKTRKAARRLGVSVPTVIGHLHVLWYWCLTHAPDGRLEGMDADDVADAAGWDGQDVDLFAKTMESVGFLDDEGGTLVVHDWWEGAGKTILRRKNATTRQRRARESRQSEPESRDSHAAVTRDTQASHGADSDIDSDRDKDLTPLRPAGRDEAEETFEQFWAIYPARHGKKKGKASALIEWRKLNVEQRRRAFIGARHLAASDELPPDAERFLRRPKGGRGDFPFDDWQTPAVPSVKPGARQDPVAARYGENAR